MSSVFSKRWPLLFLRCRVPLVLSLIHDEDEDSLLPEASDGQYQERHWQHQLLLPCASAEESPGIDQLLLYGMVVFTGGIG
jgi:hypothetical protein